MQTITTVGLDIAKSCQNPWHQAPAVARIIASQAPDQGYGDRTCQQDRTHGLGHDGKG